MASDSLPFGSYDEIITAGQAQDYVQLDNLLMTPTQDRLREMALLTLRRDGFDEFTFTGHHIVYELNEVYAQPEVGRLALRAMMADIDGALPRHSTLANLSQVEYATYASRIYAMYHGRVITAAALGDLRSAFMNSLPHENVRSISLPTLVPDYPYREGIELSDDPSTVMHLGLYQSLEAFLDGNRRLYNIAVSPFAEGINSLVVALHSGSLGAAQLALREQGIAIPRSAVAKFIRDAASKTPKKETPEAQSRPTFNDQPASEHVASLAIKQLSGKQLKEHVFGAVLKSGRSVTLGEVYTFDGFGENASVAAAFINNIAAISEDALTEELEKLANWLATSEELLKLHSLSATAKHQLQTHITVIRGCASKNFTQVASTPNKSDKQLAPQDRVTLRRLQLLQALVEKQHAHA